MVEKTVTVGRSGVKTLGARERSQQHGPLYFILNCCPHVALLTSSHFHSISATFSAFPNCFPSLHQDQYGAVRTQCAPPDRIIPSLPTKQAGLWVHAHQVDRKLPGDALSTAPSTFFMTDPLQYQLHVGQVSLKRSPTHSLAMLIPHQDQHHHSLRTFSSTQHSSSVSLSCFLLPRAPGNVSNKMQCIPQF